MSRGAAKKRFTLEDLREQTAGVECRKDGGVHRRDPAAPTSASTRSWTEQRDLVEVVAELKQVMCIKG